MSLPPLTTVFCIGFPENWILGIDIFYFNSTPKFNGVKLIPSGLHTFHWGANLDSVRSGKFFVSHSNESQLIILKWDQTQEAVLTESDIGELDVSAIKSRLGDAYRFMIVYDDLKRETLQKAEREFHDLDWEALTHHIDAATIARILPKSNIISSTSTTAHENEILRKSLLDAAKDRANKSRDVSDKEVAEDEIIRTLVDKDVEELRFTEIDIRKKVESESSRQGRDLTNIYLDKSWYLIDLIKNVGSFQKFLGEFELAFILLQLFANYSGALQWFKIVQLFLGCEEFFSVKVSESLKFLSLFKMHLKSIVLDYFDQFWDTKAFTTMIVGFHENIYSPEGWQVNPKVMQVSEEIFKLCESKFGISFPHKSQYELLPEDENEDGPTVVDL